MRLRALTTALILVLAVSAQAGLVKFKDWASTPQAYFMTKAERAQWTAIQTDADAEQFVTKYVASRGAGFAAEVDKRAALADKYLTVGKTAGSKSLRGKVIILLGPPATITKGEREVKGGASATMGVAMGAATGPPTAGDMAQAADRGAMSGGRVVDYTFAYTADKLPASYGKAAAITVTVDPNTGTDKVEERRAAADLDALLEAAAVASVKP
jgi:GWxTD domain-containing protein